MRVLIWGYWAKNLGDDLFLESYIERYGRTRLHKTYILSYKQYKKHYQKMGFVVICRDGALYRIASLFTRKLLSCEPFYLFNSKSSVFVGLGGSLFAENKTDDEEIRQYNNLKVAVARAKYSCVIGANFGPYKNDDYLKKYKSIFRRLGSVSFRDYYSYNLFSDLRNVKYAPDLILAGLWKKNNQNYKIHGEGNIVSIAPIELVDRKELVKYRGRYNQILSEIIEYYSLNGYTVYLLPFCAQEGDLALCKSLQESAIKRDKVFVCDSEIDQIISIISSSQIVYSTRFHAIILSLYFEKTCIPFIYDDKVINAINSYTSSAEVFEICKLNSIESSRIIKSKGIRIGDLTKLGDEAKRHFSFLDNVLGMT